MIKDDLLMLSTEEYSDQCHAGPFKVLKDFNITEVAELVKTFPPSEARRKKTGPDDVIAYLKANAFIVEVPCKSTHLGCYGNIDLYGDLE